MGDELDRMMDTAEALLKADAEIERLRAALGQAKTLILAALVYFEPSPLWVGVLGESARQWHKDADRFVNEQNAPKSEPCCAYEGSNRCCQNYK